MTKDKLCEESGVTIGSEKEKSYKKELDSIKVEQKSKNPKKLDNF
jgi:hypothetical protein